MREKQLISVVVLNWNGIKVLNQCLSSLRTQTYTPLEIIVVDNTFFGGWGLRVCAEKAGACQSSRRTL